MQVRIADSWKPWLQAEFEKPYFQSLTEFIRQEYQSQTVYPPGRLIFNAFEHCSFEDLKVVILGQDPYHGPGQANGLSFSVSEGVRVPPSLVNIFKEIQEDLSKPIPKSGNLERWAAQGVLMLNAVLTVRANTPRSHRNKGWESFTQSVVQLISDQKEHVVFMLWGKDAQERGAVIDREKHLVLESAHPSPYSADKGFFGNRHFSQANAFLEAHQLPSIDW
ncbi:MAG: uracil-DNA glycosylase [Microscillaceae bacterium]|nr:uracil-DNA glycosylase [Microscillaceae bacterium]